MTGVVLPLQAPAGLGTRLRALADLINEALRNADTPAGTKDPVSTRLHAGPVQAPARVDARVTRPRPGPVPDAPPEPPAVEPEPAPPAEDAEDNAADHSAVWALVTRAQAGDGEAFGQLYDRYVDTVFRFVYYRVNDRALAEDFTSETFLRALRRIGTISYQGRDIGAWFVTIARNIVLDHVKSARNRLEVTTGDTLEGREQAQSTESAVLRTLDSERLMAAIATLGDEQRECVMLRFIHGMSVSETAEIMGKNDGAIKALQHRAVRKLADLVGGELR
jgi:RNA polymerase sigma-70 factor (ECF subfamily)